MKRIPQFYFGSVSFGVQLVVSSAQYASQWQNVGAFDANQMHTASKIRDLGTGETKLMKKPKIDSKKDKISKSNPNSDKEKKTGKGKGKDIDKEKKTGKGKDIVDKNDDDYHTTGKGMAEKKGMMGNGKEKSRAPIDVETTTPSTTPTPAAFTPSPMALIPTVSPSTLTPIGDETKSPIVTSIPSPVALETDAPLVTQVPTAVPVVLVPSAPPILISPTNYEFIGASNILVRYELLNSTAGVTLNQTTATIDLTCDYIRNAAIIPLGALEFACIWFLPEFDENGLAFFPLDITYTGTAAFPTNETNITTEILDVSMITALTPPMVRNLTEILSMELPTDNPFSQTEEILAVV